jgi:hypothetical protein
VAVPSIQESSCFRSFIEKEWASGKNKKLLINREDKKISSFFEEREKQRRSINKTKIFLYCNLIITIINQYNFIITTTNQKV